jgi:hypothetical protein
MVTLRSRLFGSSDTQSVCHRQSAHGCLPISYRPARRSFVVGSTRDHRACAPQLQISIASHRGLSSLATRANERIEAATRYRVSDRCSSGLEEGETIAILSSACDLQRLRGHTGSVITMGIDHTHEVTRRYRLRRPRDNGHRSYVFLNTGARPEKMPPTQAGRRKSRWEVRGESTLAPNPAKASSANTAHLDEQHTGAMGSACVYCRLQSDRLHQLLVAQQPEGT